MQRWQPVPALQGPSVKWGDRPAKDNTAKVPSMLCEAWPEGAYLRQHVADCFLCDIFSNRLDILLQIWNYAFILMYDGYVH